MVRLSGGLGNQLFQYALGRAVAARRETTLLLDARSGFQADPYGRTAALRSLPIRASWLDEQSGLVGFARRPAVLRMLALWPSLARRTVGSTVHREGELFGYDRSVFECALPAYFMGYWQNLQYFAPISDALRSEIAWRGELTAYAQEVMGMMRSSNSVAVHIRDYRAEDLARFAKRKTDHRTLPHTYHRTAMEQLERRWSNLRYFVFSKDPIDLELFRSRDCVQVDARRIGNDLAEQWLMSQCRHQIIANSTYSWWAAWLNAAAGKTVFAPRRWFESNLSVAGILPAEWHILDL